MDNLILPPPAVSVVITDGIRHYAQVITGQRSLVNNSYKLTWTVNEGLQNIELGCQINGIRKWCGVGLTHNQSKFSESSNLMVAMFDPLDKSAAPTIRCYRSTFSDPNPRPVSPCYASLVDYSVDEPSRRTTVRMRRSLGVDPGSEQFNAPIIDGPSFVVAAYGTTGNFTFSEYLQDSVTINFWDTDLLLPSFTDPHVVFGSRIVNDNYRIYWWTNLLSNQISFQMVASTTGWFAMALAPSTTNMAGAAITSCTPIDSVTTRVENWFAAVNGQEPSRSTIHYATLVCGHYNNVEQKSSCTFSRPLSAECNLTDCSIRNGTRNLLWAFSMDNSKTLNYHGTNRGGYQANLLGGSSNPQNSDTLRTVLLWLHGGFMSFAWAVCAPLGIYVARYAKRWCPLWWLRWHFIIFFVAVLCGLIGFVLVLGRDNWQFDLTNAHTVVGFMTLIGSLVQPLLGIVADRAYNASRREPPMFPDKLHWYMGRVLWLMGLLNIYLGLELVNAHFSLKVIYYFWVALLIAIFVFTPKAAEQAPIASFSDEIERRRLL